MPIVNLKEQYPHLAESLFLDIPDPIFEVYDLSRRKVQSYERKLRRYKAYFTLDADDGIENASVYRVATPEEILMRKLEKEQLDRALEHLPDIQSRRIRAYYIERINMPEIARREGVSTSTVSRSIHNGLINLRNYYQKHYHQNERGAQNETILW